VCGGLSLGAASQWSGDQADSDDVKRSIVAEPVAIILLVLNANLSAVKTKGGELQWLFGKFERLLVLNNSYQLYNHRFSK